MQLPVDVLRRCWFLAGPTAIGKTEVGLVLAEQLGAEIVSLDSMSLYRGMDVGTAKPSPNARRAVPHHLVDVLEPHQQYSLAEYVTAAHNACREILRRHRTPLFVGGTGLYLRGVLRGVLEGPPADWDLRRALQSESEKRGPDHLYHKLLAVDASAAAALHPHDTRRVIRALEVYHLTGRPLSEQQQQDPLPPEQRPQHVCWLLPPRDWLYDRINRRVERMFADGLIDEVRRLLSADQPLSRTARQALGYKEVIDHLHGRANLEDTIDRVQTRTRQLAKRQCTWFRNLEECFPVEMTGEETPRQLAGRILTVADG